MSMSKIGNDNLYLGGFMSLSNTLALRNANITHVVTVMRGGVDKDRFKSFQGHLHIAVDDISDEDLLQHFPTTNAFIRSGLEQGGGVLIHCAMGKSRSATVCIAFLLHRDPTAIDPHEALRLLRETRQMCEPNDGFMEQLKLYHEMGCPESVENHPIYQRWLYQRAVEESVACGRGPELEEVRFEDKAKSASHSDDKGVEVRCRKCRRQLAALPFIIPHDTPQQQYTTKSQPQATQLSSACAHVFLHPLTWMRPSLFPSTDDPLAQETPSESPLAGRLVCPNATCGANIGKFAWPGMRCSCGTWVVPAIALARARVDVVDVGIRIAGLAGGGAGIRMPPGMRVQGNKVEEERGLL
ncbi:Dual specificity phosphatase, catalytic domain containing protein [Coccidioides posadasii C735 delta SOWgp]|uniref:protein-tyrosine-phosphatase n=2 Tax=Coccidioides posadasii TaxID=199306 RepID=A0A0J6INK1_COCPO|nr:Dual specificity phosphatase, catalytic domain containing protein [Coccidioides posadasii C735 delta SOWgp]EER26098.1 Dual specificity phosphatase, catalytic domain containing protein [Coccidioides posadasii C735 delta SOWgp]KMM73492.1 dual-specificity tyrosine phosphatase YVH1 [Coccidioides posadasii RMSCC 3488]|eukprot:XP_003068243.1 Dual specificity phosphatase, catalytic domain containing protein [Coccidioides posadasii C735 delta SOWgp]